MREAEHRSRCSRRCHLQPEKLERRRRWTAGRGPCASLEAPFSLAWVRRALRRRRSSSSSQSQSMFAPLSKEAALGELTLARRCRSARLTLSLSPLECCRRQGDLDEVREVERRSRRSTRCRRSLRKPSERGGRRAPARAHGPLLSFLLACLARVRYVSQPQSKPVSSRAALVLRAQLPLSCSLASSLTHSRSRGSSTAHRFRMQRVEDKDKGTRAYSATKTAAAPMPVRERERGTSVSKAEEKGNEEAEGKERGRTEADAHGRDEDLAAAAADLVQARRDLAGAGLWEERGASQWKARGARREGERGRTQPRGWPRAMAPLREEEVPEGQTRSVQENELEERERGRTP